jgi:hypothetical protein
MDFEQLQVQSLEADEMVASASANLRRLEHELERLGDCLEPGDYAARRGAIEQAELRVAHATAKAQALRDQVDKVREVEAAKLARETAQRLYDTRLSELRQAEAEILSKREAMLQAQRLIPMLEQKRGVLLFEIDQARTRLAQLPQEVVA